MYINKNKKRPIKGVSTSWTTDNWSRTLSMPKCIHKS